MKIRTNAKINLFLKIVGPRPDGFHEIETILHSIGFGDDMEVSIDAGTGIEVEMIFDDGVRGPAPPPRENLIHRAAERLLDRPVRHLGQDPCERDCEHSLPQHELTSRHFGREDQRGPVPEV